MLLNMHIKPDVFQSLQVSEGSVAPALGAGLTLSCVQLSDEEEEEMADLPMMCATKPGFAKDPQ